MRLAGGPRVFDKTLSNDAKRLVAEAVELATLLRRHATQAPADTSKETVFENGRSSRKSTSFARR